MPSTRMVMCCVASLSLAWRPRLHVSARLRAFIDWMVELMAPYDAAS